MQDLFCPDCGELSLRCIEVVGPPDTSDDERKEVRTCDRCENIVYIVRKEEIPW